MHKVVTVYFLHHQHCYFGDSVRARLLTLLIELQSPWTRLGWGRTKDGILTPWLFSYEPFRNSAVKRLPFTRQLFHVYTLISSTPVQWRYATQKSSDLINLALELVGLFSIVTVICLVLGKSALLCDYCTTTVTSSVGEEIKLTSEWLLGVFRSSLSSS